MLYTFRIRAEQISSYHIIDLKRQNRLKVGTDKPKLKVKMQSVSDDDVRKKDFLKSHVLSWRRSEKCIQTGEMLHPPAGRSRSGGKLSTYESLASTHTALSNKRQTKYTQHTSTSQWSCPHSKFTFRSASKSVFSSRVSVEPKASQTGGVLRYNRL